MPQPIDSARLQPPALVPQRLIPAQVSRLMAASPAEVRRQLEEELPFTSFAACRGAAADGSMVTTVGTLRSLSTDAASRVLASAGLPPAAVQRARSKQIAGDALSTSDIDALAETVGLDAAGVAAVQRLRAEPGFVDLCLDGGTPHRERVDMLLDLHAALLGVARSHSFTPEATSAAFSILWYLHDEAMTRLLSVQDCRKLLVDVLAAHTQQAPPFRMKVLNAAEKSALVAFVEEAYFANYELYRYAFTAEQSVNVTATEAHRAAPAWTEGPWGPAGSGQQEPPTPRPLSEAMEEADWKVFVQRRDARQQVANTAVFAVALCVCAASADVFEKQRQDSGLRKQLREMREGAVGGEMDFVQTLQQRLQQVEDQLPAAARKK
eukprot:TRINITY_DN16084_c0_g1_i1.p1 TRINITY_DN16084_c0_g1~~TRINITY_DN16084_c0_g1_i1.p1  ORF type:complete len:380 (+),score=97.81 TRINITY_DN16084_c0_g1_i1:47-1186(+)